MTETYESELTIRRATGILTIFSVAVEDARVLQIRTVRKLDRIEIYPIRLPGDDQIVGI